MLQKATFWIKYGIYSKDLNQCAMAPPHASFTSNEYFFCCAEEQDISTNFTLKARYSHFEPLDSTCNIR
jgi:hypothetical protein